MSRSIIPSGGNDKIYTPENLAIKIINHFDPRGSILEPCFGTGSFYNNFPNEMKYFCEIDLGKDFFKFDKKVDWIITNPPFSQFRKFLQHSMKISNNIVFLSLINAFFMKARLRDMKENNFSIKEILFIETPPKPWPQFGIQLGCVLIQKDHVGDVKISYLD